MFLQGKSSLPARELKLIHTNPLYEEEGQNKTIKFSNFRKPL